jgi:iron(III) transport system permease protein
VPTFIGLHAHVPTLSTAVYEATDGTPSDINLASAYGGGFLLLAVLGLLVYQRITAQASRFATISGRGYAPRRIDLGRWRWPLGIACLAFVTLAFGLPVLVLAWASLLPFYAPPSAEALARVSLDNYLFVLQYPTTVRSLVNSFVLAIGAGTVASLLTLAAAWLVVRAANRWGRALDLLVFVPRAFPGIVLGLSLLWIYISLPFSLYGTLWVIGIAYVTRFMPMSMRFSYAAMIQVHRELEEAAQVAGGTWPYNFRRVILPLVMSGFVSSWIFVAAYSFRELSASILLAGPGSEVAAVTIWDLWNNGKTGPTAALCMLVLVLLGLLLAVFRVVASRFGLEPRTEQV